MKKINIIKEYSSEECRLFNKLSSMISRTDDDELIIYDNFDYIRNIMRILM